MIFELAQRGTTEAVDLRRDLGLDAGYLSRILGRFRADGLVETGQSPADGRRQVVRLTAGGRAAFDDLDARAAAQVETILAPLAERDQRRLVGAMGAVTGILEPGPPPDAYVLRPLGPGDVGWIVHRHGVVYAEEYGFDETFEALVARILVDYVTRRDPMRECGWIADVDGQPAGCIFCMRKSATVAQLRLLLVEPAARGLGVGTRLVDECVRFARRKGYRRLTLWTNDILRDARRVYQRAGFELVEEEPDASFGREVVAQTWNLDLTG